jgi:hypothetical protein
VEATISNLGLSHATVTPDDYSGVVSVSIGSVDQRVVLSDDPAVLLVLLHDSVSQLEAIAAG